MNAVRHLKVWVFVCFFVVTKQKNDAVYSEARLYVTKLATLADATKFATITNSDSKTVIITFPMWKGKLTMNKFRLTHIESKVLITYAKCGMNIDKTSDCMRMPINTLQSYFLTIKGKTGIDPMNFFGLSALINARCIYQDKACYIIYDGGNERIEPKVEQRDKRRN